MGAAFAGASARALRNSNKARCAGLALLSALALVTNIGTASATVYSVSLNLGATGTATGDIVTDGTFGTISSIVHIKDWTITVNDGSGPVSLLGPLSGNNSAVSIGGLALSATAQALLFNFSSPSSAHAYFIFEIFGSPVTFLCFGGGGGSYDGNCAFGQSANVQAIQDQEHTIQSTILSGTQAIAASTPLPGAVALFTTGLGALGLLSRRAKRKRAALAG